MDITLTNERVDEMVRAIDAMVNAAHNREECAHDVFPEVTNSEALMTVVVGVGEQFVEHAPMAMFDPDTYRGGVQHSLIFALAIGLAVGEANALAALDTFDVPDDLSGEEEA